MTPWGSRGALTPIFDEGLTQLAALVRSRPLLAFDYDGTLAPIVADPRRARMREATRRLFADLTHRFPCVVVTGRSRDDVLRFLGAAEPAQVIGNHGAETGDDGLLPPSDLVSIWRSELDERLETMPGIEIEDKSYSLTIHYRACPDRHAARTLAMRASAALDQVRIVTGIESLNLVPRGLPDKGSATLRACERFQCDKALFVGDDQTDEDAFSADPARILGVRIGRSERSGASYCLRNQLEIDLLLGRLVELHGEWSN